MNAINSRKSLFAPTAAERLIQRKLNIAATLLVLSFLIFLFQLVNLGTSSVSANGWLSLPVSIRADSRADYSRDPKGLTVPPIGENILYEIIADTQGTGSIQERTEALKEILASPVPTELSILLPVSSTPTTLPLATPLPVTVTPQATPTPQTDILPTSTTQENLPSSTPTSTEKGKGKGKGNGKGNGKGSGNGNGLTQTP